MCSIQARSLILINVVEDAQFPSWFFVAAVVLVVATPAAFVVVVASTAAALINVASTADVAFVGDFFVC